MKKVFLILAMAVMPILASAQWRVGGSMELVSRNNGYDVNFNSGWQMSPYVGYQINDNWEVFLGVSAGRWTSDVTDANTYIKEKNWSLAPRVRWTFARAGKFAAYLDGVLCYTQANYDTRFVVSDVRFFEYDLNMYRAVIYPGVKYALNDRITLLANMPWMRMGLLRTKNPDEITKNTTSELELPALKIGDILDKTTLGIQVNL